VSQLELVDPKTKRGGEKGKKNKGKQKDFGRTSLIRLGSVVFFSVHCHGGILACVGKNIPDNNLLTIYALYQLSSHKS
jgi:hypothetical protein